MNWNRHGGTVFSTADSQEVVGFIPVHVWVLFGFSSLLPQSKNMHLRSIGKSKLSVGVNSFCLHFRWEMKELRCHLGSLTFDIERQLFSFFNLVCMLTYQLCKKSCFPPFCLNFCVECRSPGSARNSMCLWPVIDNAAQADPALVSRAWSSLRGEEALKWSLALALSTETMGKIVREGGGWEKPKEGGGGRGWRAGGCWGVLSHWQHQQSSLICQHYHGGLLSANQF